MTLQRINSDVNAGLFCKELTIEMLDDPDHICRSVGALVYHRQMLKAATVHSDRQELPSDVSQTAVLKVISIIDFRECNVQPHLS